MPDPTIRKIFISCVSNEFRTYRLRLAAHLSAARLENGESFDVKIQEDFQQGTATLLEKLADYVRECDCVIHFVGEMAGTADGKPSGGPAQNP